MRADNDNNLFTPATLAEAWGCSEQHVRNLLNRGELAHFRLGAKLIRIPGAAVEEFQCRMTSRIQSAGTEESSASSGTTKESGIERPSTARQRARRSARRRAFLKT